MSTRCNIIIKEGHNKLWFYRHSDGYPTGVVPELRKFMTWVKEGKIRKDVGQAAGWLIIIGHEEYKVGNEPGDANNIYGWKVGAFEPTTGQHGDIAYLYTLNLNKPDEIVCDNLSGEVRKFDLVSEVEDF